MDSGREEFRSMSLEDLADRKTAVGHGSQADHAVAAEFLLRQTEFLERQARAAEEATKASQQMAESTKQYTKYMFWSVFVLAASTLVSLIFQLYGS